MNAEQIEADIRKKVQQAMADAAYDIAFDIQAAYESSIEAFYNDFSPSYYNRTYATYTGSDSAENYSKNIKVTDKDFRAGIHVGSEFVQADYKDPIDYVFSRTYEEGIHGTSRNGVMSPSSKILMDNAFKNIKSNLGSYVRASLSKYL